MSTNFSLCRNVVVINLEVFCYITMLLFIWYKAIVKLIIFIKPSLFAISPDERVKGVFLCDQG